MLWGVSVSYDFDSGMWPIGYTTFRGMRVLCHGLIYAPDESTAYGVSANIVGKPRDYKWIRRPTLVKNTASWATDRPTGMAFVWRPDDRQIHCVGFPIFGTPMDVERANIAMMRQAIKRRRR